MSLSDESLDIEEQFFADHLSEWLAIDDLRGKWALIKGSELIGAFDKYEEVIRVAADKFGVEPYMISQIIPEQTEVTTTPIMIGLLFGCSHAGV